MSANYLLIHQRQVELQLRVVRDEDALADRVVLWTTCAAHHLHYVQRAKLRPASLFRVIDLKQAREWSFKDLQMYLSALDDHSVSRQVDTPGQRGGRYEYLKSRYSYRVRTAIISLNYCTANCLVTVLSARTCNASYPMTVLLYLDVAVRKEVFHKRTVHAVHSSVMDGEAVGEEVLEVEVLGLLSFLPQDLG